MRCILGLFTKFHHLQRLPPPLGWAEATKGLLTHCLHEDAPISDHKDNSVDQLSAGSGMRHSGKRMSQGGGGLVGAAGHPRALPR